SASSTASRSTRHGGLGVADAAERFEPARDPAADHRVAHGGCAATRRREAALSESLLRPAYGASKATANVLAAIRCEALRAIDVVELGAAGAAEPARRAPPRDPRAPAAYRAV